MSGYVRFNEYDFVNQYTLEQLQQLLPSSEAHYIAGTTRVTIQNAPKSVPIKLLCDRFVVLTDKKQLTEAEKKTATIVGNELYKMYQNGYWEYVEGLPCCFRWIYDFPCSFICCDCPSSSIMETLHTARTFRDKLLEKNPQIFDDVDL